MGKGARRADRGGKAVPAIFYKESDRGVNKPAEIRR